MEYSTSSSPFSLTKKTRSKSSASEEQEWRDLNISLLQKKVDDLINGSNEISTTDVCIRRVSFAVLSNSFFLTFKMKLKFTFYRNHVILAFKTSILVFPVAI